MENKQKRKIPSRPPPTRPLPKNPPPIPPPRVPSVPPVEKKEKYEEKYEESFEEYYGEEGEFYGEYIDEESVIERHRAIKKLDEEENDSSTVWDCSWGDNSGNGIMVSVTPGVSVFLDENLKKKLSESSELEVKFTQIFRGPIKQIVEFLPPEQSEKLSTAVVELNRMKTILEGGTPTPVLTPVPIHPSPSESSRSSMKSSGNKKEEESKRNIKYKELLKKAQTMDFTEFERMRILRVNVGKDKLGRPVVVFKERNFSKDQLERLIYYLLYKLDPITDKEYVLVWCIYNSRRKGDKVEKPGLPWLLNVYRSLSRKVRKNLKSFYLIHPTLLYSVIIKFFRPFVSKKFWKKLHLCNTIQEVEKYDLSLDQCPLPPTTCAYNIEKFKEKCLYPLFEVTINDVFQRKENQGKEVPVFLDACLDYISQNKDMEGLFRKAGNRLRINDLKLSMDHGYNVDLNHCDVHTVTGTLKMWFREMKEPIIPFDLYEQFLNLDINDVELIAAAWKSLPRRNYKIAERMFLFLKDISELVETNKMDSMNLAIVFGPNVLRANGLDRMRILKDSEKVMNVINAVIVNARKVFV